MNLSTGATKSGATLLLLLLELGRCRKNVMTCLDDTVVQLSTDSKQSEVASVAVCHVSHSRDKHALFRCRDVHLLLLKMTRMVVSPVKLDKMHDAMLALLKKTCRRFLRLVFRLGCYLCASAAATVLAYWLAGSIFPFYIWTLSSPFGFRCRLPSYLVRAILHGNLLVCCKF